MLKIQSDFLCDYSSQGFADISAVRNNIVKKLNITGSTTVELEQNAYESNFISDMITGEFSRFKGMLMMCTDERRREISP